MRDLIIAVCGVFVTCFLICTLVITLVLKSKSRKFNVPKQTQGLGSPDLIKNQSIIFDSSSLLRNNEPCNDYFKTELNDRNSFKAPKKFIPREPTDVPLLQSLTKV